jgi:hypothetical protein
VRAGAVARGVLATLVFVVAAAGGARAQEAAVPAATPDAGAPARAASVGSAGDADDSAWRDYDAAFRALVEGRRDDARRLIATLVARAPTHPAAARGAALLRLWPASGAATGPARIPAPTPVAVAPDAARAPLDEDEPEGAPKGPTSSARAELASFQTFHGIAVGLELCVLMTCNDPTAGFGLPLIFGGLGLTVALISTPGGALPGNVAVLDAGVWWGAWNATALGVIAEAYSSRFAGGLLLGQALGLGTGAVIAHTLHPEAGEVSLANTAGLWSGAIALFARGSNDFHGSDANIMKSLLLASDAGLAGGFLLAAAFPMSRGHALLIDAGGVGGALLGLGAAALIGGDGAARPTYFKAMLPSTVLGLAAAAYFTRRWDTPDVPVALTLAPVADGHGAAAVLAGQF